MTNRIAKALEEYYRDELYDIITSYTSMTGYRFKTMGSKKRLVSKLTTYLFYRYLTLPQVDVARFLNLSIGSVYLYVKEIDSSKEDHIVYLRNKAVELASYSEYKIEETLCSDSKDHMIDTQINYLKSIYND